MSELFDLENDKRRNILSFLVSFLLGSFCMLVTLLLSNLIFGKYSLTKGDVMYNYIPAIRDLCRDIISGNSIFYTWTYGLGTNTSLYNAYYSFSPLNILYLLFYKGDMNAVTAVCIVLKTGLAALCFNYFVAKCYKVDCRYAILFSVFYSMCSYQVAFNVHNIIWLDAMYVLPMALAAVYKLVEEGKAGALAFWLTYIFISQFYMGYMIGIISVAYLLVFIYGRKREKAENLLIYRRFAVAVLCAIGVAAVIWLPALMFLLDNAEAGLQGFSALKANVVDVYNQLFWGEVSNFDAVFPYIFCGTPALLLVPSFLLNRNIDKRMRIGFGTVIVFLLISCVITPVYALWHGFDEPDLYAYRFSYIISFLFCLLSAIAINHMKEVKLSMMTCLLFVNVLIYIVEMFWQKSRYNQSAVSNSIAFGIINLLLCLIWISLIWGIMVKGSNQKLKIFISGMMIVLAIFEMTANGYVILEYKGRLNGAYDKNHFNAWAECDEILSNALTQDESLYRVDMVQDMNPSAGTYWGVNSMSYFCSAENVKLRYTLSKLGLWSSPRTVTGHGLTPVTDMLLGVKYNAYGAIPSEDGQLMLGINANDYVLSLGFMTAEDGMESVSLVGANAFENNNDLVSAMTGQNEKVFNKIDNADVECIAEGIIIEDKDSAVSYSLAEGDEHFVKYIIPNDSQKSIYGSVVNESSHYDPNTFRVVDKDEIPINTNGSLTISYIKPLYIEDNVSSLLISTGEHSTEQEVGGIVFYELDEAVLQSAYDKLATEQFEITEFKDGHIAGNVVVSDRKMLFTSIPYDKGWKAYVDGKKVEVEAVVDGAFMAVRIEDSGVHEVVFDYSTPGLLTGAIISVFCLVICLFVYRKKEY